MGLNQVNLDLKKQCIQYNNISFCDMTIYDKLYFRCVFTLQNCFLGFLSNVYDQCQLNQDIQNYNKKYKF